MKKIILSLAGVMAAVAFAPEASAVPAFARQTGMACSACHFQSYPVLTSFGKSFKTAGFTMMGAQPLIEGEHGLSLPSTLNMGVYMQARVNQSNRGNGGKANIEIPDEFALFMGGRVTANAGVLVEYNLKTGGFANLKFPITTEVGDMKLSLIPFSSDGLGPQFAFDLFATGSTANGRVIENGDAYSASMYMGTNQAATGAAVVLASELFHVSVTPYAGARTSDIDSATGLGAMYVRAGFTPSVAGWDLGLGVQSYSGDAGKGATAGGTDLTGLSKDAATIFDAQAQGELGGMPVGIYASFGSAGGAAAGVTVRNRYNDGTEKRTAFGVLAEVGVIPNTLMVDVGFMSAKTGLNTQDVAGGTVAGSNETDNAFTLGAKYKLAQNMKVGFAYTMNSGSAYDKADVATGKLAGSQGVRGKNRLSVVYSFGF
jgi:hypothetical protein